MSLLLNIDTATETASVCVSSNGAALSYKENDHQREHASFLHTAIEEVLNEAGKTLEELSAIAVTSGPGSYTGLRVGMATAKGFCYALQKPLITINTLEVMTTAALDVLGKEEEILYCPMIDARRMEVFTALYTAGLEIVLAPAPVLLEENFFNRLDTFEKIVFFGSGSIKFRTIASGVNFVFAEVEHNARHLGHLADEAFKKNRFGDLVNSGPDYFKEFHSSLKTNPESKAQSA